MLRLALKCVLGLALAIAIYAPIAQSQQAVGPVQLSGAQLRDILAKEVPWAGVNHLDGCVFLTTGPAASRTQFRRCPDGSSVTIKGSQTVEADRMCITWQYTPRRCTEWYQVGENKFQQKESAAAPARNTIYLLK